MQQGMTAEQLIGRSIDEVFGPRIADIGALIQVSALETLRRWRANASYSIKAMPARMAPPDIGRASTCRTTTAIKCRDFTH